MLSISISVDKKSTIIISSETYSNYSLLISGVNVASWLTVPPVKPLAVQFTSQADENLQQFFPGESNVVSTKYQLQLLKSNQEARSVIHDIIASDPRSTYRRNKCSNEIYHFTIDILNVSCRFEDDVAIVTQIEPIDDVQHMQAKLKKVTDVHE